MGVRGGTWRAAKPVFQRTNPPVTTPAAKMITAAKMIRHFFTSRR